MNLSEIDFIQVVVRIRGKYHMVLLNEATKRMLPELIAGMEGTLRLLETELPLEEISIEEMTRISEMSSAGEKLSCCKKMQQLKEVET